MTDKVNRLFRLKWMLRREVRFLREHWKILRRDIVSWQRFWRSYDDYNRLAQSDQQISPQYLYPILGEDTAETVIEPIYFYQDAWAFEKIVQQRPPVHVDVASHHKFVALLSKVVPVTMVDIRPLSLPLNTLKFKKGSILDLPFEDSSLPSVSSMCVIEHIGLGRYGDELDPDGTKKALEELKRVVQPGGDLYLSVPLDDENRIYFNAHRAFNEDELKSWFAPFDLIECRYIYSNRFLEERQKGFGVGCYHLKRAK